MMRVELKRESSHLPTAAFAGWLPLILVNAVFVQRVHTHLGLRARVLHHLYDAGQILGLAACSWLLVSLLCRLPRRGWSAAVGGGLVFAAHYVLLRGDLEGFLTRHASDPWPWCTMFALASTAGLFSCIALGSRLSGPALRWVGLALGGALATANHLVLELDYPGTHFILAWSAASLIGAGFTRTLASWQPSRSVRRVVLAVGLLSVLSYVVIPGAVVRPALLGSSGAVAAPFVARAWTRWRGDVQPTAAASKSAWFKPRRGLPAIPAERLPGAPAAPNVILLTLDAIRADVIEDPKLKKSVPHLRAMAKQSLRFTRVWSPAAATRPSIAAIFLGTYFSHQQWIKVAKPKGSTGRQAPARPAAAQGPYIAALLGEHGVSTVHLMTHSALARGGGVGEGFGEQVKLAGYAPSEQVVAAVLARLDQHPSGPQLIYSHILDAHAPYNRGASRGSQKQRYVAEISVVDAAIGQLRSELRKRKLDRTTYLIVTADHGEAFYEHGRRFHASTVYEEMIRVPLFIEGPGVQARRVDQPVTLLDLSPSILSLFGVATPAHFMGQSLLPYMRGETPKLTRPMAVDGQGRNQGMLFRGRMKAIVDRRKGTEELYDLVRDPGEQNNLADTPKASAYFDTLRAFFGPPVEVTDMPAEL